MELQMIALAIFLALLLLSLLLFIFPPYTATIPKTLEDLLLAHRIIHISHRGGSAEHLENTILAFKHALDLGTIINQLDVYLTADGQVVVHHDMDYQRVWGSGRKVRETNYQQASLLRPVQEIELHFGAGKYRPDSMERQNTSPPLLEDVFRAFPFCFFNIELKTQSRETAQKVSDLIDEHIRHSLTIWGAKDSQLAQYMKQLQPKVPLFFTPKSGLVSFVGCLCCCLPCIKFDQEVAQLPMFSTFTQRWIPATMQRSFLFKTLICCFPCIGMCFRLIIWHLKRRGHPVFLWTLNQLDQFDQASSVGANGIMTDRPTLLARYLKLHK